MCHLSLLYFWDYNKKMSSYGNVTNIGNLHSSGIMSSVTAAGIGLTGTSGPLTSTGTWLQPESSRQTSADIIRLDLFFNSRLDNEVPKVLYPVDFDLYLPTNRFHFKTWIYSKYTSLSELRNDIYLGSYSGLILFKSKKIMKSFNNWMKKYSKRFDYNLNNDYFPLLTTNHLRNGAFVEYNTSTIINKFDVGSLIRGLDEILPAWVWINENCKRKVWKITEGWLFESAYDATLFKMFDSAMTIDFERDL